MAEKEFKIRFLPDNVEVNVNKGTTLLSAAMACGVHINASCGGNGVCGTCKIRIESGTAKDEKTEKISAAEYSQGIRLACRTRPLSDMTVTIPISSRLDKAVQARERSQKAGAIAHGWKFNPPVAKYYLELNPASIDDNVSDLTRLNRGLSSGYGLSGLPVEFEAIQKLPTSLREGNWKITVTVLTCFNSSHGKDFESKRIIDIEAGDTRKDLYAIAIDLGTTTVCGQLLDLTRGTIICDSIVFNKQISYGSDVITRIAYTQKNNGLKKLQEVAVDSINEVIANLSSQCKVDINNVYYIAVAGNTTMEQILLGLDPKYIRLSPYTPAANFFPPIEAKLIGINLNDHSYLYSFPCVSSYVGGDIVSGILAAGVYQREELTLYMDLGTNGEIVIGNSEWMVTASCSAGPAFEGGGIKYGMVAMKGAINEVDIDPETLDPKIDVIGDVKPKGICGSGLIGAIAHLMQVCALGQNGKFDTRLNSKRIRQGDDGYEYVIAWADETQINKDIVITEVDIDNLIRAKAAMYAGCHTLSKSVNIDCSAFEKVILAGNFGSSLDIDHAIMIGLLPDLPHDRFVFVGNGSLSGARLVGFSLDMLKDSRKVGEMMTNIELSESNDFSDNYIAALFLPHTDEKAFASVTEKLNGKCKVKRSSQS